MPNPNDPEQNKDARRPASRNPLVWIVVIVLIILFIKLAPDLTGGPKKVTPMVENRSPLRPGSSEAVNTIWSIGCVDSAFTAHPDKAR